MSPSFSSSSQIFFLLPKQHLLSIEKNGKKQIVAGERGKRSCTHSCLPWAAPAHCPRRVDPSRPQDPAFWDKQAFSSLGEEGRASVDSLHGDELPPTEWGKLQPAIKRGLVLPQAI